MSAAPTVAVVTGAGRGMGRACADALAGTVDVVVLVDRDADLVETASVELTSAGTTVNAFQADVTDRARLDELAELVAGLGTLRLLKREGAFTHLVAHRDHLRVGEAAALPVGAVDDEGVAGDEPGVGRRQERRCPAELAQAADA